MKKSLESIFLALSLFALHTLSIARAAVPINVNLPHAPGSQPTGASGPLGFVQQFYNFGLTIGGVLAFGAIVYGGIKYTFAAGNPSGQSEGKEWIKSALIGLLLLAMATLILRTINPGLVHPTLPTI